MLVKPGAGLTQQSGFLSSLVMDVRKRLFFSVAAVMAVVAGCSIAPEVPVQPTDRNVLAEIVFTDTT